MNAVIGHDFSIGLVGLMGYRVLVVPPGRPPVSRSAVRKPRSVARSGASTSSAAVSHVASPVAARAPSLDVVVSLSRMRNPSLISMPSTTSFCDTSDSVCDSSTSFEPVESVAVDAPGQEHARAALETSQIMS